MVRARRAVPARSRGLTDDHGQVLPLMAIVLMITMVALVLLSRVGGQLDDRARAQAAADAVALAGAREGEDGAGAIADADGAVLLSFVAQGSEVEVVVRLGHSTATARARRRW